VLAGTTVSREVALQDLVLEFAVSPPIVPPAIRDLGIRAVPLHYLRQLFQVLLQIDAEDDAHGENKDHYDDEGDEDGDEEKYLQPGDPHCELFLLQIALVILIIVVVQVFSRQPLLLLLPIHFLPTG